MSYTPRIYRSVQFLDTGVIVSGGALTGTFTITSVNTNYTAVQFTGMQGGNTGGSYSGVGCFTFTVTNGTTITWDRGVAGGGGDTSSQAFATVLEFNPVFLRQPIATFLQTATFAHGLTLGANAYIICGGWRNGIAAGGANSADIFAAAKISGANVVMTATGAASSMRIYIVDPV